MFYLIGLGLNKKSYSREASEVIEKADKIYIENYTVDFPYKIEDIEKQFKEKKFISKGRKFIEQGMDNILEESKKKNVAVLVYGCPLFATTHISLIQEAKKQKIEYRVIYGASVFDALGETGLQLYKFGKITSIPNFEADSYTKVIKENKIIKSHTLILIDIGMSFKEAIKKLKNDCKKNKIKLEKIILCECLGMKSSKIYYDNIKELLKKKIKKPFCIVIPSKLHFMEKNFLENI